MTELLDDLWAAADDQRRRTIALLETLSADDWARPSLCDGWAIRDVVGHLLWQRDTNSVAHLLPVVGAMIRGGGDMNGAIADLARRRAARHSDAELLAEVRTLPGHHKAVFGTGVINNLVDPIVHHHDIALPLGRGLDADPRAAATAASWTWGQPKGFTLPVTVALARFRWKATDIDWERGEGPIVEGPMVAILCALMGREAAFAFLGGPGAEEAREGVRSVV